MSITPPPSIRQLSDQDHADFQRRGYLRLPNAFPRESALSIQDFMWDRLRERHGIERQDPNTWQRPWSELNRSNHNPIYQGIASPRLLAAIGELLPRCTWKKPRNWGGFIVSPPDAVTSRWSIPLDGWHWDGGDCHGLFVLTHFSQILPHCGGTAIMEGSHHHVQRLLDSLPAKRPGHLTTELMRRIPSIRQLIVDAAAAGEAFPRISACPTSDHERLSIVEATGSPGDAYLCHPLILHARPRHHGQQPRFMRGMLLNARPMVPLQGPPADDQ